VTSRFVLVVLIAACTPDDGPLSVRSISPTVGSAAGGTRITLDGTGFSSSTRVEIGGALCESVMLDGPTRLSCTTGSSDFREGAMDVVVSRDAESFVLPGAFAYECPWTTNGGRRSCGAAPAGQVAPQMIAGWLTQFDDPNAFVIHSPVPCNLADTSDFALGSQSMWFETDGAGGLVRFGRSGMAAFDFRDRDFKIWIKLDNVAHLSSLEVQLGDSSMTNAFKFRLRSAQGQQWMTEGDWVAFTVPWAPSAITGSPDRGAITDVRIAASDDATGQPVRVHLNAIAAVDQPVMRFPNGAVSFSFDDDWSDGSGVAAPILAAHGFGATSYVIVETVGGTQRASLDDLHALQDAGWDIAVHSATDEHHSLRYPKLSAAEVEDDMVDARAWLMEKGFKGFDHCAYPGGDFTGGSTDVLALAGRYFSSCRSIYEQQRETYPPSDGRKLRVLYVTSSATLASLEQAIDSAREARAWIILVFHHLVASPSRSTDWATTDFAALVDYVAASGMDVAPVSRVLSP
jgi:peptidoglycan/xylan/chitin deacetylase (PgdA/CDA1 family)